VAGSGTAHLRAPEDALLRVEELVVEFPVGRTGLKVNAVTNVSLDVLPGETLGLVGESGCGKSTTGKAIMQLPRPQSGKVMFDGNDMTKLEGDELRRTRTLMKMIFQDPISSLNPRRRVRDIVGEPLAIWGAGNSRDRQLKVREVLEAVGLDYDTASHRRPHEFSGGQCQRISVARALALEPRVLICDEPVSALDVSVQAQILNLLLDLQERLGLTYLFVSHDLSVVNHISDRVAVMYVGQIVELADTETLFGAPRHPYTSALLAAIPVPDPRVRNSREPLPGEVANPAEPPSGCYFHPRCRYATEQCRTEAPVWREVAPGHQVRCHRAEELSLAGAGDL
jgi:peptide/nickel transport system ATP-binding protein